MELKELIKEIEHGELHPVTGDATLGFYCAPSERRLPEPRPASAYEQSGIKNFPYQQTPKDRDKTPSITAEINTSFNIGWILALPTDVRVITLDSRGPIPVEGKTYKNTDYIENYITKNGVNTNDTIFTINTKWVIDVPDGYSVFYTSPANFTDNRFDVIPGVVDADKFPLEISVPIIPLKEEFNLNSGLPLIHVYPFNRKDYAVSACTGTLTEYGYDI